MLSPIGPKDGAAVTTHKEGGAADETNEWKISRGQTRRFRTSLKISIDNDLLTCAKGVLMYELRTV